MGYALGIDFGTTNSVVSIYRNGKAETIPIEGQKTFPSVISFKDEDNMILGHQAKKRALMDPEHSISSSKIYMGDKRKFYKMYSRNYIPVDVACFILRKIAGEASKILGAGDIKDVVITVPVYFTDAQRSDTKEAAKKAGLNVIRLLPEPAAVAIAYGLDKGKNQNIIVYDLGGGKFDVAIVKIEKNNFRVMAVEGDSKLGGNDFDIEIMKYLAAEFKKKSGKDILLDKSKEAFIAMQMLRDASETAKIELSSRKKTEISVTLMGSYFETELTLEKYNSLIKPYLNRTLDKMKQMLKDAKISSDDIDRVILAGGSTRNTLVKEMITDFIKEPYISSDIDEVVSHGASIYASNLKDSTPSISVTNVTAHSVGIEVANIETREIYFLPIIQKNTKYPYEFGTGGFACPSQKSVSMNVYRGEDRDINKNTKLGKLVIPLTTTKNTHTPVTACFSLDENGMINFTAVEFSSDSDRDISSFVKLLEEDQVDIRRLKDLIRAKKVKSINLILKES